MYQESESMKELHKIREQMHEETKHMTDKEFIEYVHKASEEAKRKYGLKFKKAVHME